MSTHEDELAKQLLAEPYRIKMVERIRLPSRAEREQILREAFYSIVYIRSEDVFIDLITDSGTGAMSDEQWAGLMRGDEAYMRSRSFIELENAVVEVFGKEFKYVIPTHQGRAAEHILMGQIIQPGHMVLSNTHFDTTREHVEHAGGQPVDLVGDWLWDFDDQRPFKGNFDLPRLEIALERYHDKVPFVMITVVNNFAHSSPVSMENIRAVSALAKRWKIPVYFDASRFAENAYFIKAREPGYSGKSIADIVREMFTYAQGFWMSAKKDGLVNIGGFIALREEELARKCQESLVLFEGFPTYGGLAGRDLEGMAVGLREVLEEAYLTHRTDQIAYLAKLFHDDGIKVSQPTGGSGVFIDVGALYGHLPPEKWPAVAFANDLYLEGAIRGGGYPLQVNTVDPKTGDITSKPFQFVRFAIPRRVYTKSHLEYVAKVMARVKARSASNKGYELVFAPKAMAQFFSKFRPIE